MKKFEEKKEVRQDRDGVGGAWSRWLVAVALSVQTLGTVRTVGGKVEQEPAMRRHSGLIFILVYLSANVFYPGACLSSNDFSHPSMIFIPACLSANLSKLFHRPSKMSFSDIFSWPPPISKLR